MLATQRQQLRSGRPGAPSSACPLLTRRPLPTAAAPPAQHSAKYSQVSKAFRSLQGQGQGRLTCCSKPAAGRHASTLCRSAQLTASEQPSTTGSSSIDTASSSAESSLSSVEGVARGPGPLHTLPMGLHLYETGEASFRVWAPCASNVQLQLAARPDQPLQLTRMDSDGTWSGVLPQGAVEQGAGYQVLVHTPDGRRLERRDPTARHADYDSALCFVDDDRAYPWRASDWVPPSYDKYIIYEMHVGSWTPEGTFKSAMERLDHVAACGFSCVQLLPIAQHSDLWGYSPRHPMALHNSYGSPNDFRAFVDRAHELGIAVIIDVVLHHGAPSGNMLWEYDGWSQAGNGGIYHEHAHDTPWGRAWAFWKGEVVDMLESAACSWLGAYRCDGLRFDSANDLPRDLIQTLTYRIRDKFPGRILTAEVTPENPTSITELGFDSVWVHSGYFDIIQQHRALGRGHHGGGDWAAGWDLPRLRTAMCLHPGFLSPTNCIKYMTGSHDQCGDQHGGGHYEDYKMIGGRHRYCVDQYGGGRGDPHALACARLWSSTNVMAAGLPMMFMGTEWAQPGWWHVDEHHRPNWEYSQDEIGKSMMACVAAAHALRSEYPALRWGWANVLHEDRPNGVMAFERVGENVQRIVVVVNCGRSHWQAGDYGCWVGAGGGFEEVFCSQAAAFGGWEGWKSNAERGMIFDYGGTLHINLPPQCCLVLKQVQ